MEQQNQGLESAMSWKDKPVLWTGNVFVKRNYIQAVSDGVILPLKQEWQTPDLTVEHCPPMLPLLKLKGGELDLVHWKVKFDRQVGSPICQSPDITSPTPLGYAHGHTYPCCSDIQGRLLQCIMSS